ncbi:MAG: methionyl-tRNA formyltransferase, partial [Paludibacteraceae bacterium]|nr:methionyl-tRNA formyltransferase [Paludibacteraceae bacterium]
MGRDLRIVYMGTPEFAVAPLKALVDGGYNVVATITVADKPAQRGMKLQASPVKQYAVEHGLPVLQPVSLKDPAFLEELKSYNADLQVVVAFRMLPEVVWAMPRLGTFNLHASLLPQYRGAAPINWAIINGDAETGVTTFFLNHTIDTGNIIMQRRTPILLEDNIGTLYDRLMEIGAGVVCETVDKIASGRVETTPQIESNDLRPAPKIFKEDCFIDWTRPVQYLHNFVRGLCPYPVAYTNLITANG